jgi:hypothetical protein
LDFYSATSLTQQSMGRQVAPHPDSVNQMFIANINMCASIVPDYINFCP